MVHPCDPYDCFSVDCYGNVEVDSDTRDDLGYYHCEHCGGRIFDYERDYSLTAFGEALCPYCAGTLVFGNDITNLKKVNYD